MVMNMHSLLAGKQKLTDADLEHHFDGNICRCTGYRPILASFKKLLADPTAVAACAAHGPAAAPPPAPVAKNFAMGDCVWLEPLTVAELCAAVKTAKAAATPYRLVAGNTGHGVYPDVARTFINVGKIPEFVATSSRTVGGAGGITVGAAVSINALIGLLQASAALGDGAPDAGTHAVLAKHLMKVANNQVRNVGSWAGNLAMCFANPDFQSDIATIMSAAGATVTLVDATGAPKTLELTEFFALPAFTALVSLQLPAASPALLRTYKVMRRHQNAHAVVNAGFSVLAVAPAADGAAGLRLADATIVFGGLRPHPTRARKTEALLKGKDISTEAMLLAAIASLEAELMPTAGRDIPFRKSLISSLFYKFWVELLTTHGVGLPHNQLSAGAAWYERPASTSTEFFTPGVCDAIPKLASHRQAAGEAIYSDDNGKC
jgi:xanthine dehydrogenase/oxidase